MEIKITKLDEVLCRIECDDMGTEMLLRDRYTFLVPNYKFHPKYKAGLWSGKIHLYNGMNKTLPIGLVYDLAAFCVKNNIKVNFANKEKFLEVVEKVDDDELWDFIDDLDLPFVPYDYQFDSLKTMVKLGRCIISSPTSSGKSLIIYMIAMWHFVKHNRRSLIIVPTIALCNQMLRDFKEYSNNNVDEEMFAMINSKTKNPKGIEHYPFVVSTWQSIYNNSTEWFSQFDVILADECHEYKATSVKKMIENCTTVKFKYGLSGTVSNDMHEVVKANSPNTMTLMGLFGDVYVTTTTRELMDRGLVADLLINMITIEHDDDHRNFLKKHKYDYDKEMKLIGSVENRRKLILDILRNTKGNSILLFNFKEEFGEPLYNDIKEAFPDHKVFYVDGDTKDRLIAQKTADEEDNVIIVASYGVFSTGISIKNIHNVFLVTPYKSLIRVLQSIGRGLRLGKNKTKCNLFDLIDDLSDKRQNITLKHGNDRYKIYLHQKYDDKIKAHTINLGEKYGK